MKTTVEISDPLFRQAQKLAARDGTTLKNLINEGLTKVLKERQTERRPFMLRDASVGGQGIQAEYEALSTDEKIEIMYDRSML